MCHTVAKGKSCISCTFFYCFNMYIMGIWIRTHTYDAHMNLIVDTTRFMVQQKY